MFHCVHFECPADAIAIAEYDHIHPSSGAVIEDGQASMTKPRIGNNVTGSSGNTIIRGDMMRRILPTQLQSRLQGIGLPEGNIDHGDGYGVGLMGGGGGVGGGGGTAGNGGVTQGGQS